MNPTASASWRPAASPSGVLRRIVLGALIAVCAIVAALYLAGYFFVWSFAHRSATHDAVYVAPLCVVLRALSRDLPPAAVVFGGGV